MKNVVIAGLMTAAVPLMAHGALADDQVYEFPVTVKGYTGSKTSSVSYTGQIARHVLHDSLKKLAGKGDGKPDPKLKAELMSYYAGKDAGRAIVVPATKGKFVVQQSSVDDISKGTELAGKTYGGAIAGMPNNMTGAELVTFWIDKASSAKKGVDLDNGYDYPQLISKFIMGGVFYNQAMNSYLTRSVDPSKHPNDKPYKAGTAYTGKEHLWDEAFGYFGIPVHGLKLTPAQVVDIAKQKAEVASVADFNGDGKIDLKSEMTFAPAYYAAGYDMAGKSRYLHTITEAFIAGRKVISSAKGAKLTSAQIADLKEQAAIIERNWEQTLAESVFKYAGSVYKDLDKLKTIVEAKGDSGKSYGNYVKHWGELKGFSLALQTGRSNLGGTAVQMNRMIGFSPVLLNGNQVNGIDGNGNYTQAKSKGLDEYMVDMLKVQKLVADRFGVRARNNDQLSVLDKMLEKAGGGESAETD
jgi:hypothetical protein